jgi:tetratricopeptide (TPR) repeat protein
LKIVVLILTFIATSAMAQEKINYVDLGAQLLKDGYTKRAQMVLEKVDVSEDGFDFVRYYTLKGILLHKLSYPTLSNIFFKAALQHGQENPSIMLYVARNHWLLRNYAEVIKALDKAGDAAKKNEQMLVIKAEAYKQQNMYKEAWGVLDDGIFRFPNSSKFYRQKFYYLMELGYYQNAIKYAQKFLSIDNYLAKDYLAVAYALRENSEFDSAAALLEEGIVKHPGNDKFVELLGQIYIDQEKYLTAALVFDWASIEYPKFAQKAATLYLKADQPIRSLQLNRRILKQDAKFRQRIGIDIYLDDYESLVAKIPALKRYGLLQDDNIAYAVGYGYFKNGDYAQAKKYLKTITDNQLFSKAARIFQQIEKCQDEPLECY